jgi:hypothetical protein
MALEVGKVVAVKDGIDRKDYRSRFAGRKGLIVQVGTGLHLSPNKMKSEDGRDVMLMDENASATCPDPSKPYLVDEQWKIDDDGKPGLRKTTRLDVHMREWFSEDELTAS